MTAVTVPEAAKQLLWMYAHQTGVETAHHAWSQLEAALAKLDPAAVVVAEGWQMVPKEPTPEMLSAAHAACDENGHVLIKYGYRAMLSAAPPPPAVSGSGCARCDEPEGWRLIPLDLLQALLRREEEWAHLRGLSDCRCITLSRDGEREYEMHTCPHQRLRDIIEPPAAPQPAEDGR